MVCGECLLRPFSTVRHFRHAKAIKQAPGDRPEPHRLFDSPEGYRQRIARPRAAWEKPACSRSRQAWRAEGREGEGREAVGKVEKGNSEEGRSRSVGLQGGFVACQETRRAQ